MLCPALQFDSHENPVFYAVKVCVTVTQTKNLHGFLHSRNGRGPNRSLERKPKSPNHHANPLDAWAGWWPSSVDAGQWQRIRWLLSMSGRSMTAIIGQMAWNEGSKAARLSHEAGRLALRFDCMGEISSVFAQPPTPPPPERALLASMPLSENFGREIFRNSIRPARLRFWPM